MRTLFRATAALALALSLAMVPRPASALDFTDSYVNAVYGAGWSSDEFTQTSTIGEAWPIFSGSNPLASDAGNWDNTFGTEVKLHGTQEFGDAADAGFSISFADDAGIMVQQAYVSLNFGEVDLTMGRFYAPIGIESVDANARATISLSNVFQGLEPFFLTGAILMYSPEEGVGGFLFITNDFDTAVQGDTSDDVGLGVGVTYTGGDLGATLQYNVDWDATVPGETFVDASQLVDLSVLYESDSLFGGIDAIFRTDNAGSTTTKTFGVELLVGVNATDAVQAGIRASGVWVSDPDGAIYDLSLFGTYDVTEGVFVRAEGRLDIESDDVTGTDTGTAFTGMLSMNATFE